MKKIAIIAATVSALSVPAYADAFGPGITGAHKASATEVCGSRGASVAGASLNESGQLVVTCGRATTTSAGSEAGGGLFRGRRSVDDRDCRDRRDRGSWRCRRGRFVVHPDHDPVRHSP